MKANDDSDQVTSSGKLTFVVYMATIVAVVIFFWQSLKIFLD